jgi:hypothetical protein
MIKLTVDKPLTINFNWWKPTQDEWAPVLLEMQKPFWKDERNPTTGRPWTKRKEPTGSWPLLRKTGVMQNTAKIVPHNTGFNAITTNYGPYQQFGTSKMVARPWLGIPPASLGRLADIAFKNIFFSKPK